MTIVVAMMVLVAPAEKERVRVGEDPLGEKSRGVIGGSVVAPGVVPNVSFSERSPCVVRVVGSCLFDGVALDSGCGWG